MNMQPILASCEEAIDSLGVKHFAIKWGHKRQYIEKIIDPAPDPEDRRNFPLHYFVDVLVETNDMRPLEEIAKQFGKMVIDAPCDCEAITPENAREILAEAQVKMGEVLDRLHTALKDDKLSRSELVGLFESSYEAFNALSRFGFGAHKTAKELE